jgi:hypothetical protein
MAQLAALWPLGMLACLAALGRKTSAASRLLIALAAVPMLVLLAVGELKPDLFELRYFAVTAPALLLLVARATATMARSRPAFVAATAAILVVSAGALLDQQTNGANPRLYDFQGALEVVRAQSGEGDVLAYEPDYLADVIAYYAPDLRAIPLGQVGKGRDHDDVFVLASERLVSSKAGSAAVGAALAELEETGRRRGERIERPNVVVWRLER